MNKRYIVRSSVWLDGKEQVLSTVLLSDVEAIEAKRDAWRLQAIQDAGLATIEQARAEKAESLNARLLQEVIRARMRLYDSQVNVDCIGTGYDVTDIITMSELETLVGFTRDPGATEKRWRCAASWEAFTTDQLMDGRCPSCSGPVVEEEGGRND